MRLYNDFLGGVTMANNIIVQHLGLDYDDFNIHESAVALNDLSGFPVYSNLLAQYPSGKAYAWANRMDKANLRTWSLISKDDIVIFIQSRTLAAIGQVTGKMISQDVSSIIWGTQERHLIYFIDEYFTIMKYISVTDFNCVIGRSPRFLWRRQSILKPDEREKFIHEFINKRFH